MTDTQKEDFEKNKVLLWGVNQASSKYLKIYDKGNNNPHSIKTVKKDEPEKIIRTAKANKKRQYNPKEKYTIDDIEFLNKEYNRLEEESEETEDIDKAEKLTDIMNEIDDKIRALEKADKKEPKKDNVDKWDEINKLNDKIGGLMNKYIESKGDKKYMEQIDEIQKQIDLLNIKGKGVHMFKRNNPIVKIYKQSEPSKEDSIFTEQGNPKQRPQGRGFKKGSIEAKEHAEKMRQTISIKGKPEIEKKASKARLVKGSEEAKEFGRKMAEARMAKKTIDKTTPIVPEKTKESKLKPWFYIGDIPKGYREATEDEAIYKKKVSKYGKYEIDALKYRFWEDYNILLSEDLSENKLNMSLILTKKKILKSLKNIEILENKIENPKHSGKLSTNTNNLENENYDSKMLQKGLNWLWRLYCKRKNKEYVKPIVKLEVEEIKYSPSEKTENQKSKIFIDNVSENHEKNEDEEPSKYYPFKNDENGLDIPNKAFDKNMVLFPKYAKKLFKKNVIFLPKFYTKEDQAKYFYNYAL